LKPENHKLKEKPKNFVVILKPKLYEFKTTLAISDVASQQNKAKSRLF